MQLHVPATKSPLSHGVVHRGSTTDIAAHLPSADQTCDQGVCGIRRDLGWLRRGGRRAETNEHGDHEVGCSVDHYVVRSRDEESMAIQDWSDSGSKSWKNGIFVEFRNCVRSGTGAGGR